jgi:ABC-2 type transport system permease protein
VYALLQVVLKEFFQLRQDKKMIPVMIVGPLVQLIALGFAANQDVYDIPMVLVDQDRTAASRDLVDRFTRSGYFELRGTEDVAARVEPWLVEGRAQIALVIGQGYGADTAGGRTASVQVIADGTDSNSAVVGLGYASRIVSGVGAEIVRVQIDRESRRILASSPGLAAARPGQIELVPRIWYNPDLKSRWFFVPAVLAMVLMLVTMMLPSMAVVREREIGTLEQISVTPLRSWQLIIGKLVPYVVVGLLDMMLIVVLARWIFGVPLRGSLLLLTFLTLLFLLNTLGLGLLVSTLVNTQQQAMMFAAFVLMVPMIYLSGLVFPIENMPGLFQAGSRVIPVRYYGIILRGVFLKGSGLAVLWPEALALLGLGTAVLTLASLRFRKSLD